MRAQITLRLSPAELARLDAAAARLHLERAAFIRSAALGLAELLLAETPPLVLAVNRPALLRRLARRLEQQEADAPGAGRG